MDQPYLALEVTTESGERAIVIAVDGAGLVELSQPDKEALEMRQFDRYQAAVVATGAAVPYSDARAGDNPPDLWVNDSQGRIVGLEVTAFRVESRRSAIAMFEREIRRRVLEEPRSRFSQLAGWDVGVMFTQSARPHRATNEPAIRELVEALATYRPVPIVASFPLPERIGIPTPVMTSFGALLTGNVAGPSVQGSAFYASMGFNLELVYSSTITMGEGWRELHRLVAKHDRPRVDHLLISGGAPDISGAVLPGEAHLLRFVLEDPRTLPRPRYIRRVTTHDWGTDVITELSLDP